MLPEDFDLRSGETVGAVGPDEAGDDRMLLTGDALLSALECAADVSRGGRSLNASRRQHRTRRRRENPVESRCFVQRLIEGGADDGVPARVSPLENREDGDAGHRERDDEEALFCVSVHVWEYLIIIAED